MQRPTISYRGIETKKSTPAGLRNRLPEWFFIFCSDRAGPSRKNAEIAVYRAVRGADAAPVGQGTGVVYQQTCFDRKNDFLWDMPPSSVLRGVTF